MTGPAQAIADLQECIRMTREAGAQPSRNDVAALLLARRRRWRTIQCAREAESLGDCDSIYLAELWWAIGERDRAIEVALKRHRRAAADGEPYVHRYWLEYCRKFLSDAKAELPSVPVYDPSKTRAYSWENIVRAFIDKKRVEANSKPRK